jgi:hypothetical protein
MRTINTLAQLAELDVAASCKEEGGIEWCLRTTLLAEHLDQAATNNQLAQSHHAPDASTQGGYTQPKKTVTEK